MYVGPQVLKPTEIVCGSIAIYANAWNDPGKSISTIENTVNDENSGVKFRLAQTNIDLESEDKTMQSSRTNVMLVLDDAARINEEFRKINNQFAELIHSSIQSYVDIFQIDQQIYDVEPYSLLKYSGGQECKSHYDGPTETARCVSAIVYLNNDYTGGELEFTNFGIKIRPEPGMLILFPSNYAYTHIAHPVETGTKYAVVTWLHDRN
jgi:hypothetical protein